MLASESLDVNSQTPDAENGNAQPAPPSVTRATETAKDALDSATRATETATRATHTARQAIETARSQSAVTAVESSNGAERSTTAAAQIGALYDPWGRSLLNTLRRWWILPALLAALGATAGGVVGATAMPVADTSLRVQASILDGQAMQRLVETAVLELESAQVFDAAAEETGSSTIDLRRRTQVAAVPDSQVLVITVTASSASQAISEADALSNAAVDAAESREQAELNRVTKETKKLIVRDDLKNSDAERARVARLGDALANNQSDLVEGTGRLERLEPAELSRNSSDAWLLLVMGLVGGALAGSAVALLLGARRGKVRSENELRRLYPHVPVVGTDELDTVVDMESATASRIVVSGLSRSVDRLQPLTKAVANRLTVGGVEVSLADHPSVLRLPSEVRDASRARLSVLPIRLNRAVLRAIDRDLGTVVLIAVEPGVTRIEQLDEFASDFGERTYLVVDATENAAT